MPPLPVIVVPGIMGTRLVDASSRSVWDPDPREGLRALARTAARTNLGALGDMASPLFPDLRTNEIPAAVPPHVRSIPGVGALVWSAYDRLVTGLADPSFAAGCPSGIHVYVAGYDWRQSNLHSARALATVVERALRDTGAPRVAIVAHSMGGLVARAFCRTHRIGPVAAQDLVASLVLLGSPTHGASKAYRALRQSFLAADDIADIDLRADIAHDQSPEGILAGGFLARYARRFPAIYELLPTRAFCRAHPTWVQFDRSSTSLADAADPDLLYADAHTGVGSPGLTRSRLLIMRAATDTLIGGYLPPRTTLLYSSQVDTETLFSIGTFGRLDRQGGAAENRGDGTVPSWSGRAAGMSGVAARHDLGSIDHGGLANDPRAVAVVQRVVLAACAGTATGSGGTGVHLAQEGTRRKRQVVRTGRAAGRVLV